METTNVTKSTTGTNTTNMFASFNCTTSMNSWSTPEIVETLEIGDSVELIYKQWSNVYTDTHSLKHPSERVFKVVYSCIDGKWNKSDPIYGKIIPAGEQCYDFNQE